LFGYDCCGVISEGGKGMEERQTLGKEGGKKNNRPEEILKVYKSF
jgi:hypothetical protein